MNRNIPFYYSIGGITLFVEADLPLTEFTFNNKIQKFRVETPGKDKFYIYHHFFFPEAPQSLQTQKLYSRSPYAVYKLDKEWIYLNIPKDDDINNIERMAVINETNNTCNIYSPSTETFQKGSCNTLTLLPTDQILLALALSERNGCILHASGMIIGGKGFLFVGHSGAGKSSIVTMLKNRGEILCDDRIILRKWEGEWRIYGTWDHGDLPVVSPSSAPLCGIFFLEQSPLNEVLPLEDRREVVRMLPFYICKPLITAEWWEKTLILIGTISREVPVYRLRFDKSGAIANVLERFYI